MQTRGLPLIVSYGVGVDSTAMLMGMAERGIRPDLIQFADVGAEKPETYDFIPVMQDWLKSVGFPPVTTVRYEPQDYKHWPPYRTIEENNLTNGTLPSIAFGFQRKNCSLKWKISPQEKFVRGEYNRKTKRYEGGWGSHYHDEGIKMVRLIGYDASPREKQRYAHASKTRGGDADDWFLYQYPLIEWGWDRDKCIEVIKAHGLPVPVKSACFFCPSSKPFELEAMSKDLLRRIVVMEARAAPRCEGHMKQEDLDIRQMDQLMKYWEGKRKTKPKAKVEGKGMRGLWGEKMMTDFIREKGLLSQDEIDYLWNETPKELVEFQERYALALEKSERESGRTLTVDERFRLAERIENNRMP
jgi:hypothetical protein